MIDLEKNEKKKLDKKKKQHFSYDGDLVLFLTKVMFSTVVPISFLVLYFVSAPTLISNISSALAGYDDSVINSYEIQGEVQEKLLVDEDYVIFIGNEEYEINGGDWIHIKNGDFLKLESQPFNGVFDVEWLEGSQNGN